MNYGKLAYLKATDLEKKLSNMANNESDIDCFEISKNDLNQQINSSGPHSFDFAKIDAGGGCDCCIFLSLSFEAIQGADAVIKIKFNDGVVCVKSCEIKSGNSEISLKSVASSIAKGEGVLSCEIESENEVVLKGFNLVVIGAKTQSQSVKIELSACALGDNISISFISNGVIKYYSSCVNGLNLSMAEFSEFNPAKTHSIIYDEFNDEDEKLTFAYVSGDNNLYLSRLGENQEMFIDSDVSSVCLGNNLSEECMVIVYVKNGRVVYKTLKQGLLSDVTEIVLPSSNFVRVRAVLGANEKSYIIATDESFANYVCTSVGEPNAEKCIENIKFGFGLVVDAYNYKERYPYKGVWTVSCGVMVMASVIVYAKSQYNFTQLNSLELGCSFLMQYYTIPNDAIVYGVDFDLNSENVGDSVGNCVYTDDCVGFTPFTCATNATSVSYGSWQNRWPFNVIRPCLLSDDGMAVYLNKNTHSTNAEGTNTNMDITSGNSGDVMIEFPKIYYKAHRTPDNVLHFKISNHKRFGFNCYAHMYKGEEVEKIYVGAYPSSLINGTYYSVSGATKFVITKSNSSVIRSHLSQKSDRFDCMNIFINTMIKILFIIKFKSLNYKQSLGQGYSAVTATTLKTGCTNSLIARTCGYGPKVTNKPEKFLGIEGFASFAHYFIDGTRVNMQYAGFVDPEGVTNNWINEDYIDYVYFKTHIDSLARRYLTFHINSYFGLFPETGGDSKNLSGVFDISRSRLFGTDQESFMLFFPDFGNYMGLFSFQVVADNVWASKNLGHRLVYFK